MKKRLVVISDCTDVAYNEMRGRILSFLSDTDVLDIEPLAPIAPFSLVNASFITRLLADTYPEGTIFYVVIDPLKEEPPNRVIGITEHKKFIFISRDTGVFSWLVQDFGCTSLFRITPTKFVAFGGKYVYPHWIARIVDTSSLEDLNLEQMSISELRQFDIPDGTVVHIDNFGLIKIKGHKSIFDSWQEGDMVQVSVNGVRKLQAKFKLRMMNENDGEWVVYPGSSLDGMPELGKVRCVDGYKELGIKIGDYIEFDILNNTTDSKNESADRLAGCCRWHDFEQPIESGD